MLGFLRWFKRVPESEYNIVYRWFQEEQNKCSMLRNELVDTLQINGRLSLERDALALELKKSAAKHLDLLSELEKAAGEILRLQNELHTREVINEQKPLAGTILGVAPDERVEIQASVPGVKPRRKKKSEHV